MTRWTDEPMDRSPRGSMFWRLWWRAISVQRPQAALALGSLMVGAAIASMLLNLYGDVRQKMTEEFRAYGANVVVAPASAEATAPDAGSTMDEASLATLAEFVRRTPGATAAPLLYGVVKVSPEIAGPRLPEFENAVAVGADLGRLRRLNAGWRVAGEAVSAKLSADTCAVGEHLAARLHAHLGDSIALQPVGEVDHASGSLPEAYRIVMVLTTGALEDDQVIIPLTSLQTILGLGPRISLVELSIPGETRDLERSVHTLQTLLPGFHVRPIRQIVYSEGKVLGTIRWLLLSLTILILVIIALCVMATMTAIILERRKDIGVMKALGAADALLVRLFMMEGAGLGLVGGFLGFLVGVMLASNMAQRLFGVDLNLHWWTLPLVCSATVTLAVLAAQVPVRVVRSILPTVVLKGE
jgi:putative ABC transport system permease protein